MNMSYIRNIYYKITCRSIDTKVNTDTKYYDSAMGIIRERKQGPVLPTHYVASPAVMVRKHRREVKRVHGLIK